MGLFGNKGDKLLKKSDEANARGLRDKASELLFKAAEARSGKAMLKVSRAYLYGMERLYIEQDYNKAVDWLLKTAKDNTVYMGDDLEYAWQKAGRDGNPPVSSTVPKPDVDESKDENYIASIEARKNKYDFRKMESLKTAAIYGYNGLARNDLAWEYTRSHDYGSIGKEDADIDKVFEWFQRAINVGYLKAHCSRGDYYVKNGDMKKAFEMYSIGAEAGDEFSMCCLATAYMEGNGCEPNDEKALYWFRKAYEKGNGDGANGIGLLYEAGRVGIPKPDDKTALEWYKKAESMGSPSGMYNIARFYSSGKIKCNDKLVIAGHYYKICEEAEKRNVALANDMDEVLGRDKKAAYGIALFYADFWEKEKNEYFKDHFCKWLSRACKYGISMEYIEIALYKYLNLEDIKAERRFCEMNCMRELADMGSKLANEFLFKYYADQEWGAKDAHKYGLQAYKAGGFIDPAQFVDVRNRVLKEAEDTLNEEIEDYQSGKTNKFLSTAWFRYLQLAEAEDDAYVYYKLGMISGFEDHPDEARKWFDKALNAANLSKYATLEEIIKNTIATIDEGGFFEQW
ncbi:MAG TPA: sel1 repeat family protein [Candidatus Alectryocaccobium stercorigallinarum]|nr:sel1 repeat family protein [Candidatus Alectryocaccobium stercorigallinarum]